MSAAMKIFIGQGSLCCLTGGRYSKQIPTHRVCLTHMKGTIYYWVWECNWHFSSQDHSNYFQMCTHTGYLTQCSCLHKVMIVFPNLIIGILITVSWWLGLLHKWFLELGKSFSCPKDKEFFRTDLIELIIVILARFQCRLCFRVPGHIGPHRIVRYWVFYSSFLTKILFSYLF